ncbi:MAG TPA: iron ABC transporter permease [Gaiellaceae bacterium]|nr:iron ABC transporter permease [Gaiellaceae bacterium]
MDRRRAALRAARAAAVLLPAGFLALFFAYPFAAILERGLTQDGGLHLPLDLLTSSSTRDVVWFTLWQAALSTALTLLLGLPLAWVVARFRFRGRSFVRALVLVPFVLPTVVVASAFLALLPEEFERGVAVILAAHVFFNIAVVVRVVSAWWGRLDPGLWDAAATLGAGPAARLRAVTLPLLGPALAASAALVFLFCFTSFGVVLILGGPGYATLETEIYNQAARLFDLRAAAALSLLQLAAIGVVLAVAGVLERRSGAVAPVAPERELLRRPRGRERVALAGVLGLSGLGLGLPVAALVERSLATPDGYGLGFYRQLGEETPALLVPPWHSVLNSLAFAAAATLVALVVGGLVAVAAARRRAGWLDALAMLPLGVSAVMLGFGFVIAFDEPPLDFRGSPWLVPVAQALVAAPFVVRILAPALRSIDERLRDAATVLGASPARVWREVDLPLVLRSLGVAAGFAFAVALGEFGATVFVARSDWPTVPVAIVRFLGRPGAVNAGQAAALSVVLMALAVAAVLAVDRVSAVRRRVL